MQMQIIDIAQINMLHNLTRNYYYLLCFVLFVWLFFMGLVEGRWKL